MRAGVFNCHGFVGKFEFPGPVTKDRIGGARKVLGHTVTLGYEFPGFETFEVSVKMRPPHLKGYLMWRWNWDQATDFWPTAVVVGAVALLVRFAL
ncbi:hypothetical protein AB4Z34_29265 [Ensifer sp. 2YAB10]|uniref:hypothetical protein n=1 Tax=unclassified Ensifer TaxID=2633371 RepID=UPI003F909F90